MASSKELEQLLGKAILDKEFRQIFLMKPKSAAAKVGVELSDKEALAIEQLDDLTVNWWAEGLGEFMGGEVQGVFW